MNALRVHKPGPSRQTVIARVGNPSNELAEIERRRRSLKEQHRLLQQRAGELRRLRARLEQRHTAIKTNDRERVEKLREWIKEKSESLERHKRALKVQREYARRVVEQRRAVLAYQRRLAESEQQMIARWGIQKGLGWLTRVLVCMALLFGLSVMGVRELTDDTWRPADRQIVQGAAFAASALVSLLVGLVIGWRMIRAQKNEAQAIRHRAIADDNAWKAYERAFLEAEKKSAAAPAEARKPVIRVKKGAGRPAAAPTRTSAARPSPKRSASRPSRVAVSAR